MVGVSTRIGDGVVMVGTDGCWLENNDKLQLVNVWLLMTKFLLFLLLKMKMQ